MREKKIEERLAALSRVEDLKTAKRMIEEIKDSFQKIQKALNYARQSDTIEDEFAFASEEDE